MCESEYWQNRYYTTAQLLRETQDANRLAREAKDEYKEIAHSFEKAEAKATQQANRYKRSLEGIDKLRRHLPEGAANDDYTRESFYDSQFEKAKSIAHRSLDTPTQEEKE